MAKGSERRIARPRKRNSGCLWGLFRKFDFHQGRNSSRLLSNREHGSGRILVADGYSRDMLDLQFDLPEMDTCSRLHCQGESKDSASCAHTEIPMDKKIAEFQQDEQSSSAEKRHLLASSRCERPFGNAVDRDRLFGIDSCPDGYDLSDLTHGDSSTCPLHSLTERFCDGLELATLLEDIYDKEENEQGLECRKNKLMDASVSSKFQEVHGPNKPDAKEGHNSHVLWDIYDKLFHLEDINSPEALDQCVQLMGTLKMLSSNQELLDKLLQDPGSKLMKYVQQLHHRVPVPKTVNDQPFQKQDTHDNTLSDKKLDVQKSESLTKKIVVLKPIPSRIGGLSIATTSISSPQSIYSMRNLGSRRAIFSLSFQDIKDRLRHAIKDMKKEKKCGHNGKDIGYNYQGIRSGSGTNDRVQTLLSDVNSCTNKNDTDTQRQQVIKPNRNHLDVGTDFTKNREKKTICILERETDFQREAKKHLSKSLHSKTDCEHLPLKQDSTALWNVLSLQDYDFPFRVGPSGHDELSLLSPQMRFSSLWSPEKQQDRERLSIAKLDTESSDCSSAVVDVESCARNSNSELIRRQLEHESTTMEEEILEGMMKIMDDKNGHDIKFPKRTCTIDEISNSHSDVQSVEIQSPRMDPTKRSATVSNSPSFLSIHNSENPEITMEKVDRPSPVSVLIPQFLDDSTSSTSPASETRENDGLPVQPRELCFDEYDKSELLINSCLDKNPHVPMGEAEFKHWYIESLLEASGLINIETWERRQSLRNLLDPFLFDEVEIPFRAIPYNLMLLFDCVCEALEGIRETYFPRKPWATIVKCCLHPFPSRERLIKEVHERTTLPCATQSPTSLNLVIGKDMEVAIWMDTSAEIDNMGIAMEDEILEEILEEMVFDICD